MLSFDGWSVGIAYCLKIILDTLFSIYVIFRAKRGNIKLLYFPAIAMLSAVIAHIPLAYDFIHILLTGYNNPINDMHLFIYLTFLQIDAFAFYYLGINLTFADRKRMIILLVSLYIIGVQIISFFLNNFGFSLEFPPYPGENLIKPYYSFNSIVIYLYIPYGMMFLGLIDTAFSIQNGIYKKKDFGSRLSVIVVICSLIFAVVFTVYGWMKFSTL